MPRSWQSFEKALGTQRVCHMPEFPGRGRRDSEAASKSGLRDTGPVTHRRWKVGRLAAISTSKDTRLLRGTRRRRIRLLEKPISGSGPGSVAAVRPSSSPHDATTTILCRPGCTPVSFALVAYLRQRACGTPSKAIFLRQYLLTLSTIGALKPDLTLRFEFVIQLITLELLSSTQLSHLCVP